MRFHSVSLIFIGVILFALPGIAQNDDPATQNLVHYEPLVIEARDKTGKPLGYSYTSLSRKFEGRIHGPNIVIQVKNGKAILNPQSKEHPKSTSYKCSVWPKQKKYSAT